MKISLHFNAEHSLSIETKLKIGMARRVINAYLPIYLPTNLPVTSTFLPIYLPTYLPSYLSTSLPIYLHTFLPIYLPMYLSIHLPTNLPTCLANYLQGKWNGGKRKVANAIGQDELSLKSNVCCNHLYVGT